MFRPAQTAIAAVMRSHNCGSKPLNRLGLHPELLWRLWATEMQRHVWSGARLQNREPMLNPQFKAQHQRSFAKQRLASDPT